MTAKYKIALAAALVVVLSIRLADLRESVIWSDSAGATAREYAISERVEELTLAAGDAEDTARRFALSGGSQDLTHCIESVRLARQKAEELEILIRNVRPADNSKQSANAAVVRRLLDEEAAVLLPGTLLPGAPAPGDPDKMRRALVALDAARSSSGVRAALLRMKTEEARRIADYTALATRAGSLYRALVETGFVITFLFAGMALWRMTADRRMRRGAEVALAAREEQYRQVVELAGDIIYRTDDHGRFIFCNQSALGLMHYTEEEVIGRSYLKLIRKDKRREAERFYLRQFARKQKSTYYEFPTVDGHGRERWVGQNVQLLFEDGKVTGFQAIAREITERKRAEYELQKSRDFVERIAATTPGILYVYDLDEKKNSYSNREVFAVLGHKPDEIAKVEDLGAFLIHPDDAGVIKAHHDSLRRATDGEIRRVEYRARHADGHWVWLAARDTPFERRADGLVKQIVGIAQDITVRKAAREKLAYQANYDALTGLPNRHYFWTRLQSSLRRSSIECSDTALCLFDVDHFKAINDRFGHAAGDEVLEAVGNIVRAELRSTSDTAGRLGGDEFCFALPGTDEDEAARVAERIRERLSTLAFGMDTGATFSVTATFGVAQSRPDMDAKALMEAADRALYRAKSAGRNRVCVDT